VDACKPLPCSARTPAASAAATGGGRNSSTTAKNLVLRSLATRVAAASARSSKGQGQADIAIASHVIDTRSEPSFLEFQT